MNDPTKDPRFTAAIDVVKRTGAREFQMRADEDQTPVVWVAVAGYSSHNGRPSQSGKINAFKLGAALDPLLALFKLCDEVVDGAECAHCHRPAGFIADTEPTTLDKVICWWMWDVETGRYVQGCQL